MRYLYLILFLGGISFAQLIDDPLLTKDFEAQQQWVDSVYAQMSTDEKIGQLFMVMAFSEQGESHFEQIKSQVKEYHLEELSFLWVDLWNKPTG